MIQLNDRRHDDTNNVSEIIAQIQVWPGKLFRYKFTFHMF